MVPESASDEIEVPALTKRGAVIDGVYIGGVGEGTTYTGGSRSGKQKNTRNVQHESWNSPGGCRSQGNAHHGGWLVD